MNKTLQGLLVKQGKRPEKRKVIVFSLKNDQAIVRFKYGAASVPLDAVLGFPATKLVVAEGDVSLAVSELEKELARGTLNPALEWMDERDAAKRTLLAKRKTLIR